jgi:hypothetical protein
MRTLIAAVVSVALMPSAAWAEWTVEAHESKTHEVRTFRPPGDEDFTFPFFMSGWKCTLRKESGNKTRLLVCDRKGSRAFTLAGRGGIGNLCLSRLSTEHGWCMFVKYEE